jgi:hypothetical protein
MAIDWYERKCSAGHVYLLSADREIDCPICRAMAGQMTMLPDGVLGRLPGSDAEWRFLRARVVVDDQSVGPIPSQN